MTKKSLLDTLLTFLDGARSPIVEPVPLSELERAAVERAAGVALPPSLAALLTFDGSWLRRNRYGFDREGIFQTRRMGEIAAEHFPGAGVEPVVDRSFPERAIALDGGLGSDTLRVLYFGNPDARGEYPVLELATKNSFTIDIAHAGLDSWLALELGLTKSPPTAKELAVARKRILGSTEAYDIFDSTHTLPAPVAGPAPTSAARPSVTKTEKKKRLTDAQLKKAIEACAADERTERLAELVADAKARKLGTKTLSAALLTALSEGSADAVRVLLDAGASPNAKDETASALYWAVRKSKNDIARLKLLLERGANPTLLGQDLLSTALWQPLAAEIIDLLCQHGCEVRSSEGGKSLLHHAVYSRPVPPSAVIDCLFDRGAPHVADSAGLFPLHYAVYFGHLEHVRRLLARGVDVNLRSTNSKPNSIARQPAQTPLGIARNGKLQPMVELLLAAGAADD